MLYNCQNAYFLECLHWNYNEYNLNIFKYIEGTGNERLEFSLRVFKILDWHITY